MKPEMTTIGVEGRVAGTPITGTTTEEGAMGIATVMTSTGEIAVETIVVEVIMAWTRRRKRKRAMKLMKNENRRRKHFVIICIPNIPDIVR